VSRVESETTRRASGAPLWVLFVLLRLSEMFDYSQRFLLDAGGLLFGAAAAIDMIRWWRG
jgi:hypothetical protein